MGIAIISMEGGAPETGFAAEADTAARKAIIRQLAAVESWGYQLQDINTEAIAATDYQLFVVDHSAHGNSASIFDREEVDLMKSHPSDERRIVLAYLSIGEAEDYRYYWKPGWWTSPPQWLKQENPDWPGNYAVRYWEKDWQSLIFGDASAYLDRIMMAGFDGVYLDRVDAFDLEDSLLAAPERMAAMVSFVNDIKAYAGSRDPSFLIVAQNGEELLADATYAAAIDALGKEDLFFGIVADGIPNSSADIRASLRFIEPFRASGKAVFLVEYLDDPDQVRQAREKAAFLDMPLLITSRGLDDVGTH
jgi:cysteinyl-tRNA synthetase